MVLLALEKCKERRNKWFYKYGKFIFWEDI